VKRRSQSNKLSKNRIISVKTFIDINNNNDVYIIPTVRTLNFVKLKFPKIAYITLNWIIGDEIAKLMWIASKNENQLIRIGNPILIKSSDYLLFFDKSGKNLSTWSITSASTSNEESPARQA
jgi:hypothetical protein